MSADGNLGGGSTLSPPEQTYVFLAPPPPSRKQHNRSVSHGDSSLLGPSSATSRPSALKSANSRGHQRALSHGQISDGGAPYKPGHHRVGSRTDFILPPGHKDTPETHPGSGISAKGHSRQASRSESIYTLRKAEVPAAWKRFFSWVWCCRRGDADSDESRIRTIVPNHLVPPKTPRKEHPNGRSPSNKVRTTKYTFLSFLPKNLLEQFHRVANLYFIFIVLLNWFPAINAFGKEVAMIPVVFVLGVTAIKDLFEDRRRRASDNRINNSTCRVYKSELDRYKKVLWRDVRVGDMVHLSNNEVVPADILLLRSSDPHGLCYLDTCNLDGETNLKQRQVAPGFLEKQPTFAASKFSSYVEVAPPSTKLYRFHGALVHPDGGRLPVTSENLLLRESRLKNTDFVEGLVLYTGHETKAMLNNGGPRYKRSKLERQMNTDVIWCVVILIVLCGVGAAGCGLWLSSYTGVQVPFLPFEVNALYEGLLTFWTFIIILQILIPLSLYVTLEMCKILQVYHIHNNIPMYDPLTNKQTECRALNITEELGQVQYIFSDKTGTLTENKMIFRRCAISGYDYSHSTNKDPKLKSTLGSGTPIETNPRLLQDLAEATYNANTDSHPQRVLEFLLVLAVCNTVVVSRVPHRDMMNASGVIEPVSKDCTKTTNLSTLSETSCTNDSLSAKDRYTRLIESRSVTPSPTCNLVGREPMPINTNSLNSHSNPLMNNSMPEVNDTRPKHISELIDNDSPLPRPRLLKLPFLSKRSKTKESLNASTSSTPLAEKPIFEAESPDELALVDAAYSYNCRLLNRTPQIASVELPGEGVLDFEVLHVLPFDSVRKCMSIVLRHPNTRQIILYCKGADSSILPSLAPFADDPEMSILVERTQTHLNSYAKQGLRVLLMAKRVIPPTEFAEWHKKQKEIELSTENRERRMRESFVRLESNLTLLGATGIEDRLQEGVPETISALIQAGIIVWVLTGDKPETAINVSYSAKLFSPQMMLLKLMTRSKDAAENTIKFYLNEIEKQYNDGPVMNVSTIFPETIPPNSATSSLSQINPRLAKGNRSNQRALVVDGKTLTFILDHRSNLTKPFLTLTKYCNSVLCCRATPLQKAYIVKVVKEQLKMRTLAIGDGANDVSMIQTADVGIGISGQEGMQAVMASDFALSRFKFLERFLLVHGHWCYDRLARMILYFFYKNATFVFIVFWFQLYCGFSASVMVDQMYLMLYNLVFTSLPPFAIAAYDRDIPERILMAKPYLYRQGRLGLSYRPHSFWITMADALYQSIVIFFVAQAAYSDTDVGIWEFGTTLTSSCIIVMLLHVAIEIKSWTIIHLFSIMASVGSFYIFCLIYNSVCDQCFGLPSNYWVIQHTMGTMLYWLIIILSCVLALLPRYLYRILEATLFPDAGTRAIMSDRRDRKRKGDDLLVSWSRSTSSSSIYKTTEYGTKIHSMTAVG